MSLKQDVLTIKEIFERLHPDKQAQIKHVMSHVMTLKDLELCDEHKEALKKAVMSLGLSVLTRGPEKVQAAIKEGLGLES